LRLLVLASCALTYLLASVHFDVGEGAGRCAHPSTAVHVSELFHAAGVRFVGGLLGLLVGFLVASNPAVAGVPELHVLRGG